MIGPVLAAFLIALSPAEKAIEGYLSCGGVVSPAAHYSTAGCTSFYCTDANGRPVFTDEQTFDSLGGFFKIHYTLSSPEAVLRKDLDANGVPDYVERVAVAFDDALEAYRRLGFRDPQPDRYGGDDRLDVYLSWLADFGGVAYWDFESGNQRADEYFYAAPAFLAINPKQHAFALEVFPEWIADILLRQVAAHELHHAIQIGYSGKGGWIREAMSVMLEQVVLDIPGRLPFVTDFRYGMRYAAPNETLLLDTVTRLGYANGLFFTALLNDMGGTPGGYAAFWDSMGRSPGFAYDQETLLDAALEAAGVGTLGEAYRRYSLRALFLGEYDNGREFKDGFRYHPWQGAVRTEVIEGSGNYDTPPLGEYGHAYFRIERPAPGGVRLTKPATPNAEWDWVRQYGDCSTDVTAIAAGPGTVTLATSGADVRGWLVVRQVDRMFTPATYGFAITAETRRLPANVLGLRMSPAPATLAVGEVAPVSLRLAYGDCRVVDATDKAAWSATPGDRLRVLAGGALEALGPGEVLVEASYAGEVTRATLCVGPPCDTPAPEPRGEPGGCRSAAGAAPVWALLLLAALRLPRRRT